MSDLLLDETGVLFFVFIWYFLIKQLLNILFVLLLYFIGIALNRDRGYK